MTDQPFDIKIVDVRHYGTSGYIEVWVRAVRTTDGLTEEGPLKGYGVEAQVIQAHYGGNVQNWLNWVKMEHQKHHGFHRDLAIQLEGLKGKIL